MHIDIIIFPGFQILDVAGPIAAFEIASRFRRGAYTLRCVAADGPGLITSSSGVGLYADALPAQAPDIILVSGGDGTRSMTSHHAIVDWLHRMAPSAPRTASVCSGAYFLAEAGLLDGKRATTHWNRSADFARRYPAVTLDPDRIFVRDGSIWTSAGITAGIDLALAMIAEDCGQEIAQATAQQLVVHQRRPGGQSQFSALTALGGQAGRFDALLAWAADHLNAPLTVEDLADQSAMSPRNFARAFRAETGVTPAKAVERLRLEAARVQIEQTDAPVDSVAMATGFGDAERMRRAFLRHLGTPPQALRRNARTS